MRFIHQLVVFPLPQQGRVNNLLQTRLSTAADIVLILTCPDPAPATTAFRTVLDSWARDVNAGTGPIALLSVDHARFSWRGPFQWRFQE